MGRAVLKNAGYSLMAVVMMIIVISFFMLAGVHLYKSYSEFKQTDITSKNMMLVQKALGDYINTHGHLPCPASLSAALDTPEFGKPVSANCDAAVYAGTDYDAARGVRIGAVPTRALDLKDTAMLDGWNSRLVYAVTTSFARPGADMESPDGRITINDINANPATLVPDTVIYALLSLGSDKRGTYNLAGVQRRSCDISVPNGENCDGDAIFTTTLNKSHNETNAFTANISFMASLLSYNWVEGGWSACSGICNSGTQVQTVECRDSRGNLATSESRCTDLKPPTTQACTLPACTWQPGDWGPCKATCPDDTGSRTRGAASCVSADGQEVGSSYCSGAAPLSVASSSCSNPVSCTQMQPKIIPCGQQGCPSTAAARRVSAMGSGIVVNCTRHESWRVCTSRYIDEDMTCEYVDGSPGSVVCTPKEEE